MDYREFFNNIESMRDPKLMPCPFCGDSKYVSFGDRKFEWETEYGKTIKMIWVFVKCGHCGARTEEVDVNKKTDDTEDVWEAIKETRKKAAELWNRRAENECMPVADVRLERHGEWQTTKKHLWYKNKDGTPDIFAYSAGFCNGVVCTKCDKHFCVHCCPDWENEDEDNECYYEHYACSCCGYETMEKTAYCPSCGAKMDGKDGELK